MCVIICACFLLLFVLPVVNALTVTPNPLSVNVYYNIEKSIDVNLTNTNAYPLYNLETDSDYITVGSIDIGAYSSKVITLKIKATQIGEFTDNVKIIGYKKVNCSSVPTGVPYDINITGSGSFPNELDICIGESVRFTNYYESWIRLKIYPETDFINQINDGSSYIRVFGIVGNFPFEIYPLIPGGAIHVTDEEIFLHSDDDDTILTLNINSIMESTNLTITTLSTDYTINYDSSVSGFLIIKNTGDKKAIKVHLEADWFTFENNDFDLDVENSRAVNFDISPYISSTDNTNKSHTISIKVKADNVAEFTRDILIFIPYADILEGNITTPEWWKAKKSFCDAYPTSPYCITDPVIVYQDVPGYDCPAILANLSAEDVQKILRESLKSFDSAETAFNYLKLMFNNTNMTNAQILDMLNQSNIDIAKTQEEVKDTRIMFFIAFFGVLFVALITGVGMQLYKYWQKKYKKGF